MNKKLRNSLISIGASFAFMSLMNKIFNTWVNDKANMPFHNAHIYKTVYGNVYYTKTGEGKPLLLIHDLKTVSSGEEWKNVLPLLSKERTVYVLDLPGCGRSDKPRMLYTQFLYDQLIYLFIKDIIGEKCDVSASGYSFPFVVMANRLQPQWFDHIIGINPISVKHTTIYPKPHNKYVRYFMYLPIIGPFIYNVSHTKKVIRSRFLTRGYYEPDRIDEDLVDLYYRSAFYDHCQSMGLFSSALNHYLNMDIRDALMKTDKDYYLIYGAAALNKKKSVCSYKKYSNRVKAYEIERTAGLPHLERPRATSRKILEITEK